MEVRQTGRQRAPFEIGADFPGVTFFRFQVGVGGIPHAAANLPRRGHLEAFGVVGAQLQPFDRQPGQAVRTAEVIIRITNVIDSRILVSVVTSSQ